MESAPHSRWRDPWPVLSQMLEGSLQELEVRLQGVRLRPAWWLET